MNSINVLEIGVYIAIFLSMVFLGTFVYKLIINSNHRFLNPQEFLPEDEIFSLKQLRYLIVLAACFVDVLYSFLIINNGDYIYLSIFDIILSVYVAADLDKSSTKNKFLLLLLVPYGSLNFMLYQTDLWFFLDVIHVPVFLYFMKVYYEKFDEYTESNGLGVTIILLFTIVFISFFLTQLTEHVSPIDALVMVSNAFTSNGYAVLGSSILGKINSILLVWGGYIMSGAGTATLTAAILMKYFNKRFEELEELITKQNDEKK